MAAQKKKKLIDTKKVCKAKHTSNHLVDYYLYKTKKPLQMPKGKPGDHGTGVCFSSLLSNIRNRDKTPNRVLYIMEDDDDGNLLDPPLSIKEKKEFIKISRKHQLLPDYVKYDWIGENGVSRIVLDISDMSPSLLYAYLCHFRYIREDPGFVRALVYLVNTKKMDFYIAYALAHRVCLAWGGHTVLDYLISYPDTNDPNSMSLNLRFAAGTYRYFNDPKKYDDRVITQGGNFNCQSTIRSACKKNTTLKKVESFFSKKMAEAIRLTDGKIEKAAKEVEGDG